MTTGEVGKRKAERTQRRVKPVGGPLHMVDEVHLPFGSVGPLPPVGHWQLRQVHGARRRLGSRGGASRLLWRSQAVRGVRFAGVLPGCRLKDMTEKTHKNGLGLRKKKIKPQKRLKNERLIFGLDNTKCKFLANFAFNKEMNGQTDVKHKMS